MAHRNRSCYRWLLIISVMILFTLVLPGCDEVDLLLPGPAESSPANAVTASPAAKSNTPLISVAGNPSITQFESPYTDGRVNIILARPNGDPYYYTEKPGVPGALTEFTLKIRKDLRVFGGSAVDARVLATGGVRIAGDEGDSTQAGYIGICGGYCLREWLRSFGNLTPKGGWFTDPTDTWKKLYGSGLIAAAKTAETNDLAFWFVNPPGAGVVAQSEHAAIVQSINPTVVRNKDETSLVFTASVDAAYFKDDSNLAWQTKHGSPTFWRSTESKVAMMTDTAKSGYKSSPGDVYLQNVKLVINVPQLPEKAKSILITVEGNDNLSHPNNVVFRKGLPIAKQTEQEMILPLGNKNIRVELKDVSPGEAETLGTGTSLSSLTGSVTFTDENYFKPFLMTYNFKTSTTESSPSLMLKTFTEYYQGTKQVMLEYTYYERNGSQYIHGTFKRYFQTGELQSVQNYTNGQEDGTFRAYLENGQLSWEYTMKMGVTDGIEKAYYPSGQLKYERMYKDGKFVPGTEKNYNEDGSLRSTN